MRRRSLDGDSELMEKVMKPNSKHGITNTCPILRLPIERSARGRLDFRCPEQLGQVVCGTSFLVSSCVDVRFATIFLIFGEISLLIVYVIPNSTAIEMPLAP